MTSDRNEQLRANLIKKLKGIEMVLGCTAEDLLSVLALEIGARLPQQEKVDLDELALKVASKMPPIDINSISQKISIAIETKMALKLDEVMSLMQKGLSVAKPNTEGIIQGVAAILQPGIAQAAQQAAETVFKANSDAMLQGVKQTMDKRFVELSASVPQSATGSRVVAAEPVSSQGGGLGSLLTPEVLGKILDRIMNGPPQAALSDRDFKTYVLGLNDGNKMRVGELSPEMLLARISGMTPGTPGTPAK